MRADCPGADIGRARREGEIRVVMIVPTMHDDAALAGLLHSVRRLAPRVDEVIVVDGAASVRAAALCREFAARWMPSAAGRGAQLCAGASAAQALSPRERPPGLDVLWFVHADVRLDPRSVGAIRAAVAEGAAGGYLRFRFAGARTATKGFLERCIALRCRLGMVYGDQAIFVTRAAYDEGPGFEPQPLFEEVSLVRALRRTGRFVALAIPVHVSPRRWEGEGYLRRTLGNRLLALGHLIGIPAARLARWYARVR